jgi:hypothetical protein
VVVAVSYLDYKHQSKSPAVIFWALAGVVYNEAAMRAASGFRLTTASPDAIWRGLSVIVGGYG